MLAMPPREIWFWQLMVTPHVGGLATALAECGVSVTFVAQEEISAERREQGWQAWDMGKARLIYAPRAEDADRLAASAPPDAIHICQGFRANGHIAAVQAKLRSSARRQWVLTETVNDGQAVGWLKRLLYRLLLLARSGAVDGVLAIGDTASAWFVARGFPEERVYPFAYFLDGIPKAENLSVQRDFVKLIFAGQLIRRKNLDLLIRALAGVDAKFELHVIGAGPEEQALRGLADQLLPNRVIWKGQQNQNAVPAMMAAGDIVVLPSRFDGWGAVASEAMMVGTPVICSDNCGVAGAVRASGLGSVFTADNVDSLQERLRAMIARGPVSGATRLALAEWATALGAQAGARYLIDIFRFHYGHDKQHRPDVPWSN